MHSSEDRRVDRDGAAGTGTNLPLVRPGGNCGLPAARDDRRASFFAETLPSSREPARLYVGIASQGRGPKLLFLRTLQTLLSGALALSVPPVPGADDPADPYLTVLAYFNALRELGAARRIVEDEIREHVASYGAGRVRHYPAGTPFADRALRQPVELTSRVSTDDVAIAKEKLGFAIREGSGATRADAVDVALATNMISVGLDITRLGLMVVQGQPKTTAEYIQATSRVGRSSDKPGLVVTLLNLHKPRDRSNSERSMRPSIGPSRRPASRPLRRERSTALLRR
jgi:Helicase conserved C-terminal domain